MVFRPGDPPRPVLWYWADAGAKCFPVPSRFASANWKNRDVQAGDLGEQPGARPWRSGAKPPNGGTGDLLSVACVRSRETWFLSGLPGDQDGGPFEPSGLPTCCVAGPPCNCLDARFDTILCEVTDLGGCPSIAQTFVLTRQGPGMCSWDGPYDTAAGPGFGFAALFWNEGDGTFNLTTTCSDPIGDIPPQPGTVCPDLDVTFDLLVGPSFPECCDSGAGSTFRFHFTG